MKKTAVFFALLMGVQVLATSVAYAGGMKGGVFYPGGEVGDENVAFFAPLNQAFSFMFPPEKITQAPFMGAIGGKEANEPHPHKCYGGYKFVNNDPVVRKDFCD